jgi:hypothetical protein
MSREKIKRKNLLIISQSFVDVQETLVHEFVVWYQFDVDILHLMLLADFYESIGFVRLKSNR